MNERKFRPGDRVAHQALDGTVGAKVGVVEKVVGDSDQLVIIARFPGQEREGYDARELVRVRGSVPGPVLLHPRHLLQVLRRRDGVMLLTIALLLVVVLNLLSQKYDWSTATETLIGLGLVGVWTLTMLASLLRDLYRRRR